MSYSIPYSLVPAPQKISVIKGLGANGIIIAYSNTKSPPELSSEGLLNLFRYDIYKLVRLQ